MSNSEIYDNLIKAKKTKFNNFCNLKLTFDYTPRVDLEGNNKNSRYIITFKDKKTSQLIYVGEISPGIFTTLYRRWYTPWEIELSENNVVIHKESLDEIIKGKKICISIDSASLGDNIAWLPIISEFRKKHKADVYVSGLWHNILPNFFPDLRFVPSGKREEKTSFVFGVGWYEEKDGNCHKRDPRTISLQQVAGDHLGVDVDRDILPSYIPQEILDSKPFIDGKYVCLATTSTADAKHWHYPGGWQSIVDYLNSIGYKVVLIHQQSNHLENVIDKTGNIDLMDRAIDIYHSDFFIGIGSGLSWLAWALRKPVVMISGFSQEFCEFTTKNYRVINKKVCHGCFNDPEHKFDRGDWLWCPRQKGTDRMFECTKEISPEMVKTHINELILREKLNY